MHGTVSRAGRKRKSGHRKPSGDIMLPRDLDVTVIAVRHPDRQGLRPYLRTNEKAGSPLGRLNLDGRITDEQLEASRLYARDCQRYQQVIGCPRPNVAALDMMREGGHGHHAGFTPQEVTDRRSTYDAAFRAMFDAGQRAARAVARTAFYGEWLPAGTTLDDLKRGLSALVHHYGLTTRRKSALVGNRN